MNHASDMTDKSGLCAMHHASDSTSQQEVLMEQILRLDGLHGVRSPTMLVGCARDGHEYGITNSEESWIVQRPGWVALFAPGLCGHVRAIVD